MLFAAVHESALFAAVHEAARGTKRPIRNVRSIVANGGKADAARASSNRRK
jgi:hypothetical protein